MNQELLISVIVPVYRVEEYLSKCVESLRNQTYRNLEIILVDDGSPDRCGAMCEKYSAADSRIRVLHKENGGLSSARNAGIAVARGDYLAFADSDDWVEPDAYEVMLAAARKQNVKLVCAGRYDVDGATMEQTVGLCPDRDEVVSGRELVSRIFRWNCVDSAAWDKLYARELFREIRYPDGFVVEDVPTTYRIALLAGKAALVAKPVYHYLHRENSITTAAVSEKTFHFLRHAKLVYADIQQHFPELEADARFLLVRALYFTVLCLTLSNEETRNRFFEEYTQACDGLKKQMGFLMRQKEFGRQEKLTALLMVTGLYTTLRRAYHWLKCRET